MGFENVPKRDTSGDGIMTDHGLYEQEWRKRTPRLDVLNIMVPKSARVEYQRLHWKGNNGGKLMVSICPGTVKVARSMTFGKLPREKAKVGRHLRTICG